jgi:hypothetical protein
MGTFNTQDLANTTWAFATAGVRGFVRARVAL